MILSARRSRDAHARKRFSPERTSGSLARDRHQPERERLRIHYFGRRASLSRAVAGAGIAHGSKCVARDRRRSRLRHFDRRLRCRSRLDAAHKSASANQEHPRRAVHRRQLQRQSGIDESGVCARSSSWRRMAGASRCLAKWRELGSGVGARSSRSWRDRGGVARRSTDYRLVKRRPRSLAAATTAGLRHDDGVRSAERGS